MPKTGQGYLILEATPSVDYWTIHITKRSYNNDQVTDQIAERHELWDKNYLRIPAEYMVDLASHEYLITVAGWQRGNGVPIVNSDPLPLIGNGEPWWNTRTWKCNGVDYAWAIEELTLSGAYRYQLRSTGDYIDENFNSIPYYMYMPSIQYGNAINSPLFQDYHQVTATSGAPSIIQYYDVAITDDFYDRDGFPLTGNIHGVQKTLGPWLEIGSIALTTNTVQSPWFIESWEGLTASFNNYANVQQYVTTGVVSRLLACEPSFAAANNFVEESNNSWSDECFDALGSFGDYDGDIDFDAYDDIFGWIDCFDMPGPGEWNSVQIVAEKENGQEEVLTIDKTDLTGSGGIPHLPSFTLAPDLYQVFIVFNSGGAAYRYLDVKSRITSNAPLSTYLTASVFPVPIQGDQYSLQLQSAADLQFRYELLNEQGVVIHQTKYTVTQGHDESHLIHPNTPLPSGILIHRFTFADGSVKSITTIK